MSKILCIALNPAIDISSDAVRVSHTHKTRTHNQRQFAGGGGINVARVIIELGGRPDLAFLSGGATGRLLEDMLSDLPIDRFVYPISDDVRVAFNLHEEETNLEYRFVPEGPLVEESEVEPVFRLIEETDADYIVASGSLPRGLPVDTYARMADRAKARGVRFILDASGEPLRVALEQARVFLAKPSIGELEAATGRKLDRSIAGEAAMSLVERGAAEYIAVSLGSDGALIAGADGISRLSALDVPVASAVGAGDAFVAGITWWLSEGHPIEDAFRFGLASGAAAVMTSGTELCRRKDVMALYERCRM